jgi:hypothetical protein
MTDAKTYDIFHPQLCMPGKRMVIIGLTSDSSDPLFHRSVTVDPLHVIRLEPLPPEAKNKPSKNGPEAAQ